MHFCQDELLAILSMLPFLGLGLAHLRALLRGRGRPHKHTAACNHGPYRTRAQELPRSLWRRLAQGFGRWG